MKYVVPTALKIGVVLGEDTKHGGNVVCKTDGGLPPSMKE